MRKLIIWICLIFTFCSAEDRNNPISVVYQLYKDFSWTAIVEDSDDFKSQETSLNDLPGSKLLSYFDANLAYQIENNRKCEIRTHEICAIDFDIIWGNQDPMAYGLQIKHGSSEDIVNVSYRYPGNKKLVKIIYYLKKEQDGWKIRDIEYEGKIKLLELFNKYK